MENKIFMGFLVVSLLFVAACSQQAPSTGEDIVGGGTQLEVPAPGEEDVDEMVVSDGEPTDEEELSSETVIINMIARQWEFEPREIRVKQGDTIDLRIQSIDIAHGIMIPEFGVNLRFNAGQNVRAEFVADKKGEFLFYCSVPCGRGHSGMIGQIIVE